MLSLYAPQRKALCDGVTRRDFMRIGGLAMGGLSLLQLLNAESQNGTKSGFKSVIMIYLCGAPPHQDMWDLRMDAPAEIRGPYPSSDPQRPENMAATIYEALGLPREVTWQDLGNRPHFLYEAEPIKGLM